MYTPRRVMVRLPPVGGVLKTNPTRKASETLTSAPTPPSQAAKELKLRAKPLLSMTKLPEQRGWRRVGGCVSADGGAPQTLALPSSAPTHGWGGRGPITRPNHGTCLRRMLRHFDSIQAAHATHLAGLRVGALISPIEAVPSELDAPCSFEQWCTVRAACACVATTRRPTMQGCVTSCMLQPVMPAARELAGSESAL